MVYEANAGKCNLKVEIALKLTVSNVSVTLQGGMSKEILLFTIVNSKKRTCNMQFQISIGPVSQVYSVLSLDCMQSEIWFNLLRLILSVLA